VTRHHALLFIFLAAVCVVVASVAVMRFTARHAHADRRTEMFTVDGVSREYLLVIPKSIGPEPVPLVIALHGTGDTPESMSRYSGLDRLASEKRFLLVYPRAVRGTWKVVGSDVDENNRDIRFVDALIDRLTSQYSVDPQRIYAVGMSNGASFALLLAAHSTHRMAAVAAHSGIAPDNIRASRTVPVMLIVGADDTSATVEAVRAAASDYQTNGRRVKLTVVDRLGHEWAQDHTADIWEFLAQHDL
jgi:polyhydroxybutyrate depolymerase